MEVFVQIENDHDQTVFDRKANQIGLPETESELARDVVEIHNNKERVERLHQSFLKQFGGISNRIVGTMATFPGREDIAPVAMESILSQVDYLVVFLNEYDSIPSYIQRLSKPERVIPVLSPGVNLKALGKTFALDAFQSCIVFSLDDDLLYPFNYVERMHHLLHTLQYQVVVCSHSSVLNWPLNNYYDRTKKFPHSKALFKPKFCNIAGSGHIAFHTDTLRASFWDFFPLIMVDLQFAFLSKEQRVPMVAIPRGDGWLTEIAEQSGLFEVMKYRFDGRTYHYYKAIEYGPWELETFREAYESLFKSLGSKSYYHQGYLGIPEYGVLDQDVQNFLFLGKKAGGWATIGAGSQFVSNALAAQIGGLEQVRSELQRVKTSKRWKLGNTLVGISNVAAGRLNNADVRILDRIDASLRSLCREAAALKNGLPQNRDAQVEMDGLSQRGHPHASVAPVDWYHQLSKLDNDGPPAVLLSDVCTSGTGRWDFEVPVSSVRLVFVETEGFQGIRVSVRAFSTDGQETKVLAPKGASRDNGAIFIVPPMKRRSSSRIASAPLYFFGVVSRLTIACW